MITFAEIAGSQQAQTPGLVIAFAAQLKNSFPISSNVLSRDLHLSVDAAVWRHVSTVSHRY